MAPVGRCRSAQRAGGDRRHGSHGGGDPGRHRPAHGRRRDDFAARDAEGDEHLTVVGLTSRLAGDRLTDEEGAGEC